MNNKFLINDRYRYAKEIAILNNSNLYYAGNIECFELPDPQNYQNRDVLVNSNGAYINIQNNWVLIEYGLLNFFAHEFVYEQQNETSDPKQWLALLEE